MKRTVWGLVFLGFFLLWSPQVTAKPYKLGFIHHLVLWSEYKIAETKGLWDKHGVEVELMEYTHPLDWSHAGQQRRFDLTPLPMAVMGMYWGKGLTDMVYLGTFGIADQHKYLIIKKSLVGKSLKGQAIGLFLNDHANLFILSSYLKTVNDSLADVRVVEMSSDELEANFIHNRLQAVLTLDQANEFYKKGDGVIAISTREFYEPHGLVAMSKDVFDAIPKEDLKNIMRGCIDGILWAHNQSNWNEYKAVINNGLFPDAPEMSDERIRTIIKEGKFVDPEILLEHNQVKLREYFTKFHTFLMEEKILPKNLLDALTFENVVQNQILIEVLNEYVK